MIVWCRSVFNSWFSWKDKQVIMCLTWQYCFYSWTCSPLPLLCFGAHWCLIFTEVRDDAGCSFVFCSLHFIKFCLKAELLFFFQSFSFIAFVSFISTTENIPEATRLSFYSSLCDLNSGGVTWISLFRVCPVWFPPSFDFTSCHIIIMWLVNKYFFFCVFDAFCALTLAVRCNCQWQWFSKHV